MLSDYLTEESVQRFISIEKKIVKLESKWEKYKSLRSRGNDCNPGHPDYLTMIQREDMLDKVFSMILGKSV